jgi:acyl carrier protein
MKPSQQLVLVENKDNNLSSSIHSEIASVFEQVLGRSVKIDDRTDIVEDLGMDSLAVMNFVMAIEDFYDISIPLDRIAQIQTVGDLIQAVEGLRTGVSA